MNPAETRVRAAAHWRVEPPFAPDLDVAAQIELAGRLCGTQVARSCAETDFAPQALVVVSTVMSHAISMDGAGQACFHDAVERACGLRPEGLLNAYMCTGWAFALRHYLRHTDVARLAIAIVDLDIHNLAWQRRHPVIGPSGFGVTTLLLQLPADRTSLPTCAGPYANSAFNEFVLALKGHQARHGTRPTFIPFTLEGLAATARRLLGKDSLGPNLNDTLGHCFGADPWIGLAQWLGSGAPACDRGVLAGAIAFNGYFAFAPMQVGADIRAGMHRLDGDASSLEAAIARLRPAHGPRGRHFLESVDA
jgi:hypothetical protein